MWVYVVSLLTTRALVLAQGVGLLVKRRDQLKPTILAKVCVCVSWSASQSVLMPLPLPLPPKGVACYSTAVDSR